MKLTASSFLLVFGATVTSVLADCWWTGCQPNSWAATGCDEYNRVEQGKEPCSVNGEEGNKYNCCANSPDKDHSVSYEQFSKGVTSNGFPAPSLEQYNNFFAFARSHGNVASNQEAAMVLAQLLHESDGLRAKREYACVETQCPGSYRYPGCDHPGQYYYGRGYIQLSWCYNYRDASTAIFGDNRLVTDADQVSRDDSTAWKTAFWFWNDRVRNKPGVLEGQFGASTKAINGGIECSSPGNSQAQKRYRFYGNIRSAFGLIGSGDPSGCA